jgi:uncharacterized membrane protein
VTGFFFWSIHALIIACCAMGLWVSVRMHAKSESDRRGELREVSVVQSPRARLFGGVDNAMIGLVYYPAVAVASLFFSVAPVRIATLIAAIAAAAMSLFLWYSLLFITKMKCTNCWIAHSMNLMLFVMLADLTLIS